MTKPVAGDDERDAAAAQAFARVRRLMVISLTVTVLAIAVVLVVIGYRVFRGEGSASADVTASLPKGARVVSTAVGEGRIVVTIEIAGQIEVRTFDLRTLKPTGRLRMPVEP